MNSLINIPDYLLERITNLPRSNEGLIVSCIFEKDLKKLNNKKRTVIDRLNFYIKYQVGGVIYNNRGNEGSYKVKSRYYTQSNTTETKGEFTFNNPEKYSIVSDFSEYDDIRGIDNKKYPDYFQVINTGNQVLNWILHGVRFFENQNILITMKGRPNSNVVIDTVVFVDLKDYSKAEILYDYTGKLNIIKKFVDKARYWSGVRLKAKEDYSPEKLKSQGYFDSDLTEDFSRLNLNSFGKKPKRVSSKVTKPKRVSKVTKPKVSKITKPKVSKKVITRLRLTPGGTKRVSLTRKSPEESATLFEPGFIKKGNDGFYWYVKKYSNGIKRWTKY